MQPKHDTHVAPLGLGCIGIRHCYKHVAPLGLNDSLPHSLAFSFSVLSASLRGNPLNPNPSDKRGKTRRVFLSYLLPLSGELQGDLTIITLSMAFSHFILCFMRICATLN